MGRFCRNRYYLEEIYAYSSGDSMGGLGFTILWMSYRPVSLAHSPQSGWDHRLAAKVFSIAASGLIIASGLAIPVRANWGRVVYVNTPPGYALNVRWGPGTDFGVHRKVRRGTDLRLTEVRRNGWLQLTDGTWVAGNLVSARPVYGNGGTVPNRNIAYVVTPPDLALNIRRGPGANYARVGQFLNGTRVQLSGRYSAGWAELSSGNWVDNAFLRSTYPDNRPTPVPTPRPTSDPYVADLQRRLVQLGYLPSNFVIDGIYGQTTEQAVREFQRVNGLPVTGVVNAATWQALYEATAPNPIPSPTPTFSPTPTPTVSPTQPPGGGGQARVVTDGEDALVFAGPDPSTDILRTVRNGESVTTTGNVQGNWTELAEGGWIFSLYLENF
jgi:peptidoglycan hydrolase-like protein with peptidoglycan-binding domain